MDDNSKDELLDRDGKPKSIFDLTPQGIAFLAIFVFMGILYAVNPFIKFTKTLLMAKRLLFSSLFILFLVEVALFYIYDPFDVFQSYFGIIVPIILSIGVFLFALVLWYTLNFTNSDVFQSAEKLQPTPITSFFMKMFIILGSVAISTVLIAWIVLNASKMSQTSYVFSLIVNILLTVAILSFVYRILVKSSILQSSPWVRLLVNSILYIPCLIVNAIDATMAFYYGEKEKTTRTDLTISLAIIVLFIVYFAGPYALEKINRHIEGGKQLVSYPVPMNYTSLLGSYIKLNDLDENDTNIEYQYGYALSFWFYIDSASPSTNGSYTKYTPLCNYGGKPEIFYKGDDNTLMVTVKLQDLDEQRIRNSKLQTYGDDNVVLAKIPDVKLQKWNHVLVNYDGGTMDVFFNGVLINSAMNIVPYMSMDALTIGSPSGVNGNICNVVYYNYTLDAPRIRNLYQSVKENDPPVLA